ncbi:C-reactive protein-like [Hoplias malabaricus]|uniref:C-reactive protein-like n=1 Tax=Hoplias malabaricus TaxID=27720 RepID=UPI003462A539
MARALLLCSLTLYSLSSVLIPVDGQTEWKNGSLQGQMFSVMNAAEVRFRSDVLSNVTGLTVCLRILTENEYQLQLTFENGTYEVSSSKYSDDYYLDIYGRRVNFNMYRMVPQVFPQVWPWKNRCFTWDSNSGMAQLWYDSRLSVRKGLARGQVFSGQAELKLYRFEGQVTDVYIWDSALSVRDLYFYLSTRNRFPGGNILDWRQIEYISTGYVLLEPSLYNVFDKTTKRRREKCGHIQKKRRRDN